MFFFPLLTAHKHRKIYYENNSYFFHIVWIIHTDSRENLTWHNKNDRCEQRGKYQNRLRSRYFIHPVVVSHLQHQCKHQKCVCDQEARRVLLAGDKKWSTQAARPIMSEQGFKSNRKPCQSNAQPACTFTTERTRASSAVAAKSLMRLLQTAHLMALLNANSVKWLCCVCKCLMRAPRPPPPHRRRRRIILSRGLFTAAACFKEAPCLPPANLRPDDTHSQK